jgi:hypothetical protein
MNDPAASEARTVAVYCGPGLPVRIPLAPFVSVLALGEAIVEKLHLSRRWTHVNIMDVELWRVTSTDDLGALQAGASAAARLNSSLKLMAWEPITADAFPIGIWVELLGDKTGAWCERGWLLVIGRGARCPSAAPCPCVSSSCLPTGRHPPPARADAPAAIPAAAAAAAPPGAGLASPSGEFSVTDFLGATFESESRSVLQSMLRGTCPWLGEDAELRSRSLVHDDGSKRQADIFGYVTEASAAPSLSDADNGLQFLDPRDFGAAVAPPAPPVSLSAQQRFSPADVSGGGAPRKYVLAECYGGAAFDKWPAKLAQLETLIEFTVRRWSDRISVAVPDLTSVVGCAGLVLSAGTQARRDVLKRACTMVGLRAGSAVKRLIQAGRFFVLVVNAEHAPITEFQRTMAIALSTTNSKLDRLLEMSAGGGGGGGR